jgi:hypothetical protein
MLVPKTKMCEDGATVAATPTFSTAGCLVIRPDRQRLSWSHPNHRENPINYRKCPTDETNVKRKTPAKSFQISSSFDSPKTDETTNETKKMQLSLRTD